MFLFVIEKGARIYRFIPGQWELGSVPPFTTTKSVQYPFNNIVHACGTTVDRHLWFKVQDSTYDKFSVHWCFIKQEPYSIFTWDFIKRVCARR